MSNKPLPAVRVYSIDEESTKESVTTIATSHFTDDQERRGRVSSWRPSLFHHGPLLGLAALLFSLLSIPACFAILQVSNNDPTDSWKYYPAVYIGIITAISNKAITFAAIEGLAVYWWIRAIKGTTYKRLHWDWKMGYGLWDALSAGKHLNLVAVACMFATLTAIDGPLLQRAITVVPRVHDAKLSLKVQLSPEVPTNSTGVWYVQDALPGEDKYNNPDMSNYFLPVLSDVLSGIPMQGAITGCPGTCSTTVRGPALKLTHCNSTQKYQDYWRKIPEQGLGSFLFGDTPTQVRYVFDIDLATIPGSTEQIMLRVGMANQSVAFNCSGMYRVTDCYYSAAIAEYPVIVDVNGTISFSESTSNPKVLQLANNTAMNMTAMAALAQNSLKPINTTLSGIAAGAMQQYTTSYGLIPPIPGGQPSLAGAWQTFSFQQILNYDQWLAGHICIPHWRDPTEQIVAGLNEMMFRMGIQAAKIMSPEELKARVDSGLETNYTVEGTRVDPVNVFKIHFWYFVAAAAVELIAIIVTACTFHGWWRLGRAVSFSPLEIAKAFDAPGLREIHPNMRADDIAEKLGDRKIQYGGSCHEAGDVNSVGSEHKRLVFR